MGYNDLFSDIRRGTGSGAIVRRNATSNARQITPDMTIHSFENANIDAEWADAYKDSKSEGAYYDYFFSGQDVKVFIDGAEEADLPIVNFGFNIEQQKVPVYGLWSYTYDAVMRGTRMVSGTFTLSTTSTDLMRRVLAKAAKSRSERGVFSKAFSRPLTEDDENIEKYWEKNIDPNLGAANKQIFSVHPPFNFVVVYGIQTTSIGPTPEGNGDLLFEQDWDPNYLGNYGQDYPLSLDVNERIIHSGSSPRVLTFTIEACEIQSLQVGYSPDGAVVSETYQFFARDLIIPTSNK